MELRDKNILVVGLARTGVATARFLASRGARVAVTDQRTEPQLQEQLAQLAGLPIRYILGRHDAADFATSDLVVVSPGVPQESPYLAAAREAGRHGP